MGRRRGRIVGGRDFQEFHDLDTAPASWRCTGRAAGDAVATAFDENGFTYGLLYARELDRAEHSRRLAHHWAPMAATG